MNTIALIVSRFRALRLTLLRLDPHPANHRAGDPSPSPSPAASSSGRTSASTNPPAAIASNRHHSMSRLLRRTENAPLSGEKPGPESRTRIRTSGSENTPTPDQLRAAERIRRLNERLRSLPPRDTAPHPQTSTAPSPQGLCQARKIAGEPSGCRPASPSSFEGVPVSPSIFVAHS